MAGRPPIFDSPEAMEALAEQYFAESKENKEPITITGLALYLGFSDRQSLYDYEKNLEFSCIVKKCRLTVENQYEKNLHGNAPTGSIFALKNMGWKDKNETALTGADGGPIAITGMTII